MITMDMIGKVRGLRLRDNLSLSETVRRTGISRNTIKKWVNQEAILKPPRYERVSSPGVLSRFEATLVEALTADAKRIKRERRSARALFRQLQAQGYRGGHTTVYYFVANWQREHALGPKAKGFVPLKFALGEAFQFDWSEEGLVVGGIYYRMQVSHMKLCASRAFWLVAYPTQGHEMLFDAHTRSFEAFGGVAKRGIYDNMKTAVDKVLKGKGRIVNARFAVMCSHYLFDPDFCNVASGWEKGVVEKNVQDSRRRIWQEAATIKFGSFIELNAWLGVRCRALWSEIRHPEYSKFTVAEVLEQEKPLLMAMPEPFDGYVEKPARVTSTCLVSVHRNRYSVPCEWVGQIVSTRLYPNRVEVIAEDQVVTTHARLPDRGQTQYNWQHYIPLVERKPGALRNGAPFETMPEELLKLRSILLKHEGGDKLMARVLGLVPLVGLADVLVAIELVLESQMVSIEHILNVLSRLSEKPKPASVETHLKLQDPPKANTHRYDGLRQPNIIEAQDET